MNLSTAPLLALAMQTAEDVIVLVDGLSEADFRRSRLTRAEVRRRLGTLADSLAMLPAALRDGLPEIDWAGWAALQRALSSDDADAATDAAWFGAGALAPATLSWLRVARQSQPAWFSFRPGPDAPHPTST